MTKIRLKSGDITLCSRLGPEEFEIIRENKTTGEFRLKSTKTKVEQKISKIYCHVTEELASRNLDARYARKHERAALADTTASEKK